MQLIFNFQLGIQVIFNTIVEKCYFSSGSQLLDSNFFNSTSSLIGAVILSHHVDNSLLFLLFDLRQPYIGLYHSCSLLRILQVSGILLPIDSHVLMADCELCNIPLPKAFSESLTVTCIESFCLFPPRKRGRGTPPIFGYMSAAEVLKP